MTPTEKISRLESDATSLRELLTSMEPAELDQWRASRTSTEAARFHELRWRALRARPSQLQPAGDWVIWFLLAGRGFGKTETGSQWIHERVRLGLARSIVLIERTPADARETMVEGRTGILATAGRHERPLWEPAKSRLTWPNGAKARVLTAAEPDKARGINADTLWGEELAVWGAPETWSNAMLGLRVGEDPRALITTTPQPTPLVRSLLADPCVKVTRGSTFENRANLADAYIKAVVEPLMGTRRGRRELEAEVLLDADGALWSRDKLDELRVREAPEMSRIVIAVDPAASSDEGSDETGIVPCGKGVDGHGYVLGDSSGRYKPEQWASRAIALYRSLEADFIVAEKNNGGEMVRSTIAAVDRTVPVKLVWASRGKHTRADPISALTDQGRIHHVGSQPELEDQLCLWTPGDTTYSPDRLDAFVWGMSELFPRTGFSFDDAIAAMEHTGAPH